MLVRRGYAALSALTANAALYLHTKTLRCQLRAAATALYWLDQPLHERLASPQMHEERHVSPKC